MVRTKVFVGNLSFQTKENELATEFEAAGKVISANIITRGPRSLGYGFVELDSEEDAKNAVSVMNKKEINGRPINVEIAKPQDKTKEKVQRPPRTEGGEGGGARRRPKRRPRRIVRAVDGGDGADNGKEEEGERRRKRTRGAPRRRRISNEEKEESKTTLFVANLPFSLDDEAFSKIVTDLNFKLKTAHVVKKRNGRSKGYGFIEFETQDEQQKALNALNKKVVDSRELSVKIALTEIKVEESPQDEKEPKAASPVAVPVEKKTTPAPAQSEKKTVPAEKKTAPVEKKTVPAEKKTTPAPAPEKKTEEKPTSPEKKVPSEKKTSPAEKKSVVVAASSPDKKPVEKKTETPEKPISEKKPATPEKKNEKK